MINLSLYFRFLQVRKHIVLSFSYSLTFSIVQTREISRSEEVQNQFSCFVKVQSNGKAKKLEVVVDGGFESTLLLLPEDIAEMALDKQGEADCLVANGQFEPSELFGPVLVTVTFDDNTEVSATMNIVCMVSTPTAPTTHTIASPLPLSIPPPPTSPLPTTHLPEVDMMKGNQPGGDGRKRSRSSTDSSYLSLSPGSHQEGEEKPIRLLGYAGLHFLRLKQDFYRHKLLRDAIIRI